MNNQHDAIVVTGMGLHCCLGFSIDTIWSAVREGRCGIGPLTMLEQPSPQRQGGQCPISDPPMPDDVPREVAHLRRALHDALAQAGLDQPHQPDPVRVGLVLGTTLAGMRSGGQFLRSDDPNQLSHFLASSTLARAARSLGIAGMGLTTCSACASGLSAVALGMTLLRQGELDVVIAGGYDPVSEYVYAGFESLRLITPDRPLPFAASRQGMKLAEASAVVVLERASDGAARGARPLVQVLGFGESSDAHHLTLPHPEGHGAARAMHDALADGAMTVDDIQMIAAHATATVNNDAAEFAAYEQVFGSRLENIPVTAFKSHLGHTLGAAGVAELILSACCLREQTVAPVASVRAGDVAFEGLNLVTGAARPATIHHTLNLSLGFGGANACVILGRPDVPAPALRRRRAVAPREREVCITGYGLLAPGVIGHDAWLTRLQDEQTPQAQARRGNVDEEALTPLLGQARRVRRLSLFSRLMLAAATLALRDAGLDDPQQIESCGALLGTTHGAIAFTNTYYRQVVVEGIDAANPMLFAEGVPNVASAQLSLMLHLLGGSQTIIGGRTAGLDALHMARLRIAQGRCDRILVGAAEETHVQVDRAYQACGMCNDQQALLRPFGDGTGFTTGAGAVVLVLESRQAAMQRSARVRGVVGHTGGYRTQDSSPQAMIRTVERAYRTMGAPEYVISSASNTWMDRVEQAALDQPGAVISSIYGHVPEMFAAGPLAALAALLADGRMPRLLVDSSPGRHARPAEGHEQPDQVGVLCMDSHGAMAGARLDRAHTQR